MMPVRAVIKVVPNIGFFFLKEFFFPPLGVTTCQDNNDIISVLTTEFFFSFETNK